MGKKGHMRPPFPPPPPPRWTEEDLDVDRLVTDITRLYLDGAQVRARVMMLRADDPALAAELAMALRVAQVAHEGLQRTIEQLGPVLDERRRTCGRLRPIDGGLPMPAAPRRQPIPIPSAAPTPSSPDPLALVLVPVLQPQGRPDDAVATDVVCLVDPVNPILNPPKENGAIGGTISLLVHILAKGRVASVICAIDGQEVGVMTAPAYGLLLDTNAFANGPHQFSWTVVDRAGNCGTALRTIDIQNEGPNG